MCVCMCMHVCEDETNTWVCVYACKCVGTRQALVHVWVYVHACGNEMSTYVCMHARVWGQDEHLCVCMHACGNDTNTCVCVYTRMWARGEHLCMCGCACACMYMWGQDEHLCVCMQAGAPKPSPGPLYTTNSSGISSPPPLGPGPTGEALPLPPPRSRQEGCSQPDVCGLRSKGRRAPLGWALQMPRAGLAGRAASWQGWSCLHGSAACPFSSKSLVLSRPCSEHVVSRGARTSLHMPQSAPHKGRSPPGLEAAPWQAGCWERALQTYSRWLPPPSSGSLYPQDEAHPHPREHGPQGPLPSR